MNVFDFFTSIGSVRDFMELGGVMMWFIALASFILWALMIERLYYFNWGGVRDLENTKNNWQGYQAYARWRIKLIRDGLIASHHRRVFTNLSFVKALIAIVPFLGLLGTVTGMIEVFDVLAQTGSANARAMAAGVSKATLPTMAGMVISLSALYFYSVLENQAEKNMQQCKNLLALP